MQSAGNPMIGALKLRSRSGRTPLQPKNSPATPMNVHKPKTNQELIEISVLGDSDKENRPIQAMIGVNPDPADPSLAEELRAMKKKTERLRLDRERTERILKEKGMVLDGKMKEMEVRGEIQMSLEMEVDRLFRLKELKCRSVRVSPIPTLRYKEQGRAVNESPLQVFNYNSVEDREMQSPGSASSQVVGETK